MMKLNQAFDRTVLLFMLVVVFASACAPAAPSPTPTATVTPLPTATPTSIATPLPTATPTFTATATQIPTETFTPTVTPTAMPTLPPTETPNPPMAFVGDNWSMVEVNALFSEPLDAPWMAFINVNDRDGVGDPSTPQPATNVQTIYLISPRSGQRVPLFELSSNTGDRVFWAPTGNRLAYFIEEPDDPTQNGLYVMDLTIGFGSRLLAMENLGQRGFYSAPHWSPDGSRLAIMGDSGYDLDIYVMNADGTEFQNLTDHPSYDMWPAWSPDGRYIAFVSDRLTCPSWLPGDGCFDAMPTPTGGNLYLLDTLSLEVELLSDERLTEPPYWITNDLVGYTSGSPVQGDDYRYLWQVDVRTRNNRRITLADQPDLRLYLAEVWSADGQRVVFQRAGEDTDLVMMDANGQLIDNLEQYNFGRYAVAFSMAPDGNRVALGGRGGQCPHGLIVTTGDFDLVSSANAPPTACNPRFSPDSAWIAYGGISRGVDGRLDLYISSANGYSTLNHTYSLRGQIRILGWIGGVTP